MGHEYPIYMMHTTKKGFWYTHKLYILTQLSLNDQISAVTRFKRRDTQDHLQYHPFGVKYGVFF